MGFLDYIGLGYFLDKLKTIFVQINTKGQANGVASLDNSTKVPVAQLPAGSAGGVASLDNSGKVPITQLPSLVNDVIEGYYYNSKFYEESTHTTEITGEEGKIYISKDTNKIYRFENNTYSEIANTDVMTGATASAAGTKGLVPAPTAGKNVQYLKGDGTWDSPALSELGFSVVNGKVCVTYQKEVD